MTEQDVIAKLKSKLTLMTNLKNQYEKLYESTQSDDAPFCPMTKDFCNPRCAWFVDTCCAVVQFFVPPPEAELFEEEPTIEEKARTL